jgi:hypothetical protein
MYVRGGQWFIWPLYCNLANLSCPNCSVHLLRFCGFFYLFRICCITVSKHFPDCNLF